MALLISFKDLTLIRGSADYQSGGESTNGNKVSKIYRLVYDSRLIGADDLDTVAYDPLLPADGDPLKPGDPRKAGERNVTALDETGCEFLVTITFSVPQTDFSVFEPNPLNRPDQIRGGGQRYTEPYFKDYSDPPTTVTTSAGEPFQTQLMRGTSGYGLTITGNRADNPIAEWAEYLRPHSSNDAPFTIRGILIPKGVGKLVDITFERVIENQFAFWQFTWSLECAKDWIDRVPDRGFYELDDDFELNPIRTGKTQEPVTEPWPLNGDGVALDSMDAEPAELEFVPCPPRDFSVFGWTAAA